MARLSTVVIPGIPHHVTQRCNGRQRTFCKEGDYALYLGLPAAAAERARNSGDAIHIRALVAAVLHGIHRLSSAMGGMPAL